MGKKIKKILVTTGIVSLMMVGSLVGRTDNQNYFGNITAYASEQTQSNRWESDSSGVWRLRNQDGVGYVTNSWFQDLDSSWYILSQDGTMQAGWIHDNITNKDYLLNPNHDGTYGRMFTADGTYSINGVSVYLTFNQQHDGTYGAITSGLEAIKSTGVQETRVDGLPTDSATTSTNNQEENNSNSTSGNTKESNVKNKYVADESNGYDPGMAWLKDHPNISAGTGGNIGGNWNVY